MNPFTTRSGGLARSRPRFFSDNNNNNNNKAVVLTDADFPVMGPVMGPVIVPVMGKGCVNESLDYKRATTQVGNSGISDTALLPGWAYLSYDDDGQFKMVCGPAVKLSKYELNLERRRGLSGFSQMNRRWNQNAVQFVEMHGLDAYIHIYGNVMEEEVSDYYESIDDGWDDGWDENDDMDDEW